MMCHTAEDVAENSQYAESLLACEKSQMVVTMLNLLYTARSRRPPEAEYSRKLAASDDGLQRTNCALIPNVATCRVGFDTKCWGRKSSGETSIGFQQYGRGLKKWVEAERRSNLKEEASDLNQLVVAAKTRESVRERWAQNGTLPLTELEQLILEGTNHSDIL
jgi:hypothetical protein